MWYIYLSDILGFLTDDLVIQDIPESQSKYLGVCRLTGAARKVIYWIYISFHYTHAHTYMYIVYLNLL